MPNSLEDPLANGGSLSPVMGMCKDVNKHYIVLCITNQKVTKAILTVFEMLWIRIYNDH